VNSLPSVSDEGFLRVQDLLGRLTHAGLDVTATGLMDALWLTLQPGFTLGDRTSQAQGSDASGADRDDEQGKSGEKRHAPVNAGSSGGTTEDPSARKRKPAVHEIEKQESTGVFSVPAVDEPDTIPASPLRIPGAAALACKLPLTRALRPQRRWFRNPQLMELDEEATVEETARSGGLLVPVMRPALERWYELVLVTDSGSSMDVWQETLKEFEEVARTAGVFRDVRRFRLAWNAQPATDGKVQAREESAMLTSSSGLSARAVGLAQTNVRRLVLIATTGVGKAWTDGSMADLLSVWGRHCSVAVLQMLPELMWPRVRMGEPSLLLRTMEAGTPMASLEARALWWEEPFVDKVGNSIKRIPGAVPILPLDPQWLRKWAGMQMGDGQWVPGIVVGKREDPPSAPAAAERAPEDWIKAVSSFERRSTPEARFLAVCLSTGPFTLPVARLVQAVKLEDRASQTQIAEILLSGLIERTTPPNADLPHEWVEYRFYQGAAAILGRGLRESDKEAIAVALARHIERYWGKPVDFHAFVYDAEGYSAIPAWAQPFARLGRVLANVPDEPEPPDDGRPTAFLVPLSPSLSRLARQIATGLESRGIRVLECGRHRVPEKGVTLIVSDVEPDSPFQPAVRVRRDLVRACEFGLDGVSVVGPGVKPNKSGTIFYDSYSSVDELVDAVFADLGRKSQTAAPPVKGAPPVDLERFFAWEASHSDLTTRIGMSTLILYSHERFPATQIVGDLVWNRHIRLDFPSGIQWLRRGETLPTESGQLLILEKFQEAVAIPEGCGCILIDPAFPVAAQRFHPGVYEGSQEDCAAVEEPLVQRLVERNAMPGETGWQLDASPHLLSVFEKMSQSAVWSSVKWRLGDAFPPSRLSVAGREERLRVAVFDAMDPAYRDSVGQLAALRPDAPERARQGIGLQEFAAALEGLDLVEGIDGATPRATETARYLARRHSDWGTWNLKVLEQFGLPTQLDWYESASRYEYIRRNLIFHLREAAYLDFIEGIISDFRWWSLRIVNDGAAALLGELRTVTDRRVFASIGRLLDSIPNIETLSAEEIARRVIAYDGAIAELLRESAKTFLRTAKANVSVAPERFILLAGSRQAPQLVDEVKWAAEAIAREIARRGFGLVSGAQPGSDQIAIEAFISESRTLGKDPALGLRIVTSGKHLNGIQLPEGTAIHYVDYQQTGSVGLADAVVVLGGAAMLQSVFEAALSAGKPSFPIRGTGSAAQRLFDRLASQGAVNTDLEWARPIQDKEDAAAVAKALIDEIAAPVVKPMPAAPRMRPQPFYPVTSVAAVSSVTFEDDPAEKHGPFVITRGSHRVDVWQEFRMGTYPVTNQLFLQFIEDNGYSNEELWQGNSRKSFLTQDGATRGPATWPASSTYPTGKGNHPVAGISFLEAQAFVRWLQTTRPEDGWTWCIPMEDMWEFSARSPHGFQYPWGNQFLSGLCNSAESSVHDTSDVSLFPGGRSHCGCAEMAGNVWEFVEGAGRAERGYCVLRGGSYSNNQDEIRNCFRLVEVSATLRAPDFGFRCAQIPTKGSTPSVDPSPPARSKRK
jgi:formylglycine-generating enzyme required for sulfatase activity